MTRLDLTVDAKEEASDVSTEVSRTPEDSSLFSLIHSSLAILRRASKDVPGGF